VLPSNVERLAGGVRFQYAVADFKTPKGVLLEGRGVIPDIAVELTRAKLLEQDDLILGTALENLRKRIAAAGSR
jgi:carboxyl-terminal processing protease